MESAQHTTQHTFALTSQFLIQGGGIPKRRYDASLIQLQAFMPKLRPLWDKRLNECLQRFP